MWGYIDLEEELLLGNICDIRNTFFSFRNCISCEDLCIYFFIHGSNMYSHIFIIPSSSFLGILQTNSNDQPPVCLLIQSVYEPALHRYRRAQGWHPSKSVHLSCVFNRDDLVCIWETLLSIHVRFLRCHLKANW